MLAAGTAVLLELTHALRGAELSTVSTRFAVRGERPAPKDVVVVGIDDVSFDVLNERFPFSRRTFARALTKVSADHPRAIAYDVQFTEQSNDAAADNALILALRKARNVVLSTTEVGAKGTTKVLGGIEGQRFGRVTVGNGLLPEDNAGKLRRIPFAVDGLPTLSVATVERAGGRIDRGKLAGDGAWIDYSGPPGHIRTVSFSSAVRGRFAPGTFRDKLVVIGATAPSLQDRHATSWPAGAMAGPEIHANAIATLMRGTPLRATGVLVALVIALVLALLAPLLSLALRPWRALGIAAVAGVLYAVAVQLAFGGGLILPLIVPLVGLAVGFIGALLVHWLTATFERAQTRDLFARFVPDSVVSQVLDRADSEEDVRLGGELLCATVLFSDLRGFTSFAESREPSQVIEVLNRYLTEMSDAILDHKGTLVAYMGDGIMAVFGAPLPAGDHADEALGAARDMLERLERFNAWMREQGLGDGFKMGIGLNTGDVMSGNVGSARRLEYTAIGDTTNTAARLEGMTKGTPYQLFVAEATRSALAQEPEDLECLDELEVRGRKGGMRVWALRPSATVREDVTAAERQPAS